MRVVFYTRSGYLDAALSMLAALAAHAEVHLIVESSPEGNTGPMGSLPFPARNGTQPWDLAGLPPRTAERLSALGSVHVASFTPRRAFHPANALASARVARLVRSLRPDVVHFDDASTRAASLLYMLPRVPVVLTVHDSHPRVGERAGRFELVRERFLKRARLVIFRSDYARGQFDERRGLPGGTDAVTIPLGVYDVYRDACEPGPEEPRTVLFFGRIAPYKGIEVLVAAAPAIAERVAGTTFVVAGDPVEGYAFEDPPPLPNGGRWEIVRGLVPLDEVCRLFHRCALVVLPYVDASQSGVVSTAFAFGKPVVASAVGGIPEVVVDGDTGRLVPPSDPAALAGAVADLLGDAGALERLGAGVARAVGAELSWDVLSRRVLDEYARLSRSRAEAGAGRP